MKFSLGDNIIKTNNFDEARIDIIGQNGATAEHYLELQEKQDDPLKTQIGGDHYKTCAIQPVEFIEANNLAFLEGCVVKRVTRHNKPTGKGKQDIEKAIHELELLLKLRYRVNE